MTALLASARSSIATEDIVANLRALTEEANAQIERIRREREDQKATQIEKWSHPASNQLPVEILLEIFKYYLEESPRCIRRLMLVCRAWHSIVTNHSRFWTQLDFNLATDGWKSLENYCVQQELYIRACLKYSGKLLWTIVWDMAELAWWHDHVSDQVVSAIDTLVSCEYNYLYDWVNSLDLAQLISDDLPSCHHQHAFDLFSLLVDIGTTNRWGTLRLKLSTSQIVNENFLDVLDSVSSLPMLHTLGVHQDSYMQLTSVGAFHSLWNLRSLELSSLDLIENLGISHSNLSSLRLGACYDLEGFRRYPGATKALQELELSFRSTIPSQSLSSTLSFPKLTALRMDLSYHPRHWGHPVDWNVPSLGYVFIRVDTYTEEAQLPRIAPKNLRWRFTDRRPSHYVERVSAMLREALVQYTTVETLYLQEWTKANALEVFQALREAQVFNGKILRVVFEKRYYNEVMALEELAGVIEEVEVVL